MEINSYFSLFIMNESGSSRRFGSEELIFKLAIGDVLVLVLAFRHRLQK